MKRAILVSEKKKAMTHLTENNFRIKYMTNFGRNLRKNSK